MYRTSMKKLLSLLTVVAMVLSMIAVVPPQTADAATVETAISNGDFENGAFGGAVSGSNGASIVEKATYEGNYALKFDATGEILTVTGYLAEATTAESTVTLSFWAKVLAGSTQNSVNFGLFATNESWGNRVEKYGAGYPIVGGDWKQISQALAVPVGTKIIQAQIYLGAAGATAIVDNISITDGNGNEILQSGGFEKGALNGDFNANDALEIVCTPVHSGNYAAHADKSSGNGNISTTVSIEPSSEARTMTFSYWMYAPTSANGAHNMVACFDTSSGSWTNLSTKYGAQYATPGVWVQKTMEIAVAANTNTLQIQLYAQDTGADFYIDDLKLTEEVTQVNHDVTLTLNQVTGDGTWQFSISEAPANKYYKVPATIDGTAYNILMGESGGIMCVYLNFFTALGGAVPTGNIIIAEGAVLKAVDPDNGWNEIKGADTYTLSKAVDLSYVDGAWSKTVYTTNVEISFNQVASDGTWQFGFTPVPAERFYKVSAIVDGTACNVLVGESGGIMCVYPNFFTAIGGAVPAESLVIPAGTVMYAVDSTNGWQVIDGANTLTVINGLSVEYNLGAWLDMSQYADVTFEEITADDLIVYKWENQAESNCRSVLGIYAPNAQFGNNAGWGNFTKVAGKVLVDGMEVSVVYGMAPGADDDSSWGANNAILLYITGEGYWDAVTTASSVTVCAGTMLVSGVDNTKGVKFTEDFTMYKNCDGSWDTTADTHVYNQQNTELEGALATAANCQRAATYYYSCACGQLGSETFSSGELGNHNSVNGSCTVCGKAAQNITVSLHAIATDGTWQFDFSATPAKFYKIPAIIDGKACDVLVGESQGLMCIYPNFFTALGGAVPAESFVIPAGTALKAVDFTNNWAEIEDAAVLLVTEELKIENIAGKWCEMSKYADVEFTEIWGADLDLYYQNIMRLGDYSDAEIAIAKLQYPEIADLIKIYGDDANMTTFGICSNIPTLQIPNDANWSNFTLLGTVSVQGATPAETYVMQTVDSSEDAETAMDSGFLIRFYNGFVADVATSVTIEPGTRIVTKDREGFVFVDGYTIYRDENGNWTDEAPESVNPVNTWGLTLGDNIGVKFEMNIEPGDEVTFAINGSAVASERSGNIYTVRLAAAQMTDEIVISVNGVALEKAYSVRTYADIVLNGTYGEKTKTLVKNMLVYGGAAQTYFVHNTGNLAGDDIQVEAAIPACDTDMSVTDNLKNINFYGASLVFADKVAVRFYFLAENVEGLTFTANGKSVQTGVKNDMYYVEIAGINPQDLANQITVSVSDGVDSLNVTYSPLNYIVRVYERETSSAELKAVVQALYGYYLAAAEYAA